MGTGQCNLLSGSLSLGASTCDLTPLSNDVHLFSLSIVTAVWELLNRHELEAGHTPCEGGKELRREIGFLHARTNESRFLGYGLSSLFARDEALRNQMREEEVLDDRKVSNQP